MEQQDFAVCLGQALVDCITRGKHPHKPNVYRADSIALAVGGDAVNEASALVKLGYQAKLVCGLGNDAAGSLVYRSAVERGIDVNNVTISNDLTTPIANLMVEADGSRISYNSPATLLEGYLPNAKCFKGAKVVSFASLFRAPLDQKDVVISLIKEAKEAGAIVCCDSKIPTYRQIDLKDIAEVLPLIDYFFPNENEARLFSGENDYEKMAAKIKAMGVKNVIVKTGAKGCVVCGEDGCFSKPALPVEVIDTTGAGDNFAAGFMAGLLEDRDLQTCVDFGLKQAAVSLTHMGAY